MVQAALTRLDGERATYFGDIARSLEGDSRAQSNANIIFTVLKDVMAELPLYLEKADLIDLLLKFTDSNYQSLRKTMFDPAFVENPASIRKVTGDFIHQVIAITLEKHGSLDSGGSLQSTHKLTWPYRETDLVDPEIDKEEWAKALAKNEKWLAEHGEDRRRSGSARIDEIAQKKVNEEYAAKKKASE